MTAANNHRRRGRFALAAPGIALGILTLTATLPIAARAESRDQQNFQRSQQRQSLHHLHDQQVLIHNQQISQERGEQSRRHDAQSRERDRQNFLRSQQKHHTN